MISISFRLSAPLVALALIGLSGCKDSGHSLGHARERDAGDVDAPVATGGTTGTGGASSTQTGGSNGTGGVSAIGGSNSTGGTAAGGTASGGATVGGATSAGGASGGAGGRGGTSTASDAGALGGDAADGCAARGESCATRSCCAGFVCLSLTEPQTCYAPVQPTPDAPGSQDIYAASDTKCPVCDPMKCAYGSPVDSNGCTVCTCNPAPDGGVVDSSCALPEGCDAGPSTPCPSAPPANGDTCLGQSVCSYEYCPGAGHIQAACQSGKWALSSGACDTVICLGAYASPRTCPVGKVCLIHVGGTLRIDCIDNPCGSGLVSADCSTTTSGCTPIFSTTSGLTYYCNICPAGQTCA